MKILYLHIGIHKTASSSIQTNLFFNNDVLSKYGYLYPKSFGPNHSIELFSAFCDVPSTYHININKGFSELEISRYNKENKEKIIKEVNETSCDNIIFSGEDISLLEKHNLLEFKKFITLELKIENIIILVSTREIISYINSAYQQTIRDGTSIDINSHFSMYKDRIIKFIEVFGKENIRAYKFEDTLKHKYGPVGFFCDLINIPNDFFENIFIIKENESLSEKSADLIYYINSQVPLIIDGKMNKNRETFDINIFQNIRGDKYILPPEIQQNLLKNSKDNLMWLKDNFNLDYSNVKIIEPSKIVYDIKYYEDIICIYNKSNHFFKHIIYHYILKKFHDIKDSTSFRNLKNLLFYFEYNKIKELNLDKLKILFENFNIDNVNTLTNIFFILSNDKFENADILREIAFVFERNKNMQMAYEIMKQAHSFRPNGPLINQKCEEYENIINNITKE